LAQFFRALDVEVVRGDISHDVWLMAPDWAKPAWELPVVGWYVKIRW